MARKKRFISKRKLLTRELDLLKQVVSYQQDLQKEQNKIMQSILADLNGIVSSIAKTKTML